MLITVATGCALGGLVWSAKELIGTLFNKSSITPNISEDEWINIWHNNEIFIKHDKETIEVPKLSGIEEIKNGIRYIFNMPLGITTKDIYKCELQIKELSNAEDVEIIHFRDNIAYINVITESDIKVFNGSIETSKWNKLWLELDLATGNATSGYNYPILVSETEIIGGISYVIQMPIGKSSRHIEKQNITIQEFLDARYIDIVPLKKNQIAINAIYEELPTKIPLEFIPRTHKDSFEIPVGKFMDGYAVLNFEKIAHVLDAGMTGSGKSIVTKSAITYSACMYTPDELNIYISDLKMTELNRFKRLKHVKKFVKTEEDTDKMLKELYGIMNERYNLFDKLEISDIYEYNRKHPESKMPYIFVVIEEISKYTMEMIEKAQSRNSFSHIKSEPTKTLAQLLFLSRACGMSFWCTAQRPTKESISPNVKSSFGNTLAFKTKDKANSEIICDDEDLLKNLRGGGHGYFITESTCKEFQAFYIDNDDIKKILTERDLLRKEDELSDKDCIIKEDSNIDTQTKARKNTTLNNSYDDDLDYI